MKRSCGSRPDAVRIVFLAVLFMVSLGIWQTGCGTDDSKSAKYDLPSYVNDPSAPAETAKAYRAAIDYSEDFARIPCYCGCGDSARHESLQDCFISSIRGDEIKFSNHGAGWGLCVDEALYVLQGRKIGTPIEEIRKQIDDKYSGGKAGKPTPTPAP